MARCWEASDPDTYAEEPDDDDDYTFTGLLDSTTTFTQELAAGRTTSDTSGEHNIKASSGWTSGKPAFSRATTTTCSGSGSEGSNSAAQTQQQRPRYEPLGGAYRLLLFCALAFSRLFSRLTTAVMATGRVTLQLAGEAVLGLRNGASHARREAAEAYATSPTAKRFEIWQRKMGTMQQDLPEDLWGKLMWLWNRPSMQKLRLTISMANFSIRLPALVALVATQVGLLSTSLSLPMLAPLLLGTGMLLRSIRTNASLVFPRIGLLVVLLWMLWFMNSVVQNTVAYLRKQGAIDQRMANNINSAAELTVLLTAAVVLLSMLGVNVSALLLPAGICLAIAAKDLSHNFLAGCFLMMVQPFRLGDRVGVTVPAGSPGSFGAGGNWFEGVCEKVDLRYTSLRQGKRRLIVPNSAFLQQPFMILEDASTGAAMAPPPQAPAANGAEPSPAVGYQPFITHDGRHIWQPYVDGAPIHQELAQEVADVGQANAAPDDAAGGAQQQHLPKQCQQQHQGQQHPPGAQIQQAGGPASHPQQYYHMGRRTHFQQHNAAQWATNNLAPTTMPSYHMNPPFPPRLP